LKTVDLIRRNPLNLFFLAVPLAIFAGILDWGPLWVFLFSALAIIPMAGYIGEATEALAAYTGPSLGGLLNATLGNAAELIITITAIRQGLLELVKASITGSILGNILLVLGTAMVFGGLRNGLQTFNQRRVGNNAILLMLAVIALVVPSALSSAIGPQESPKVETLTLGVAAIMIFLYAIGLLFSYRVQGGPLPADPTFEKQKSRKTTHSKTDDLHPGWSLRTALIVLAVATVGVAYFSELLVGAVEPVVKNLGVSEFFLGIILIPIVGNVAEHLVAVKLAIQNKMELSVEIAISSSLQIALFVAPVLVFVSLFLGHPLLLIFNQFELLALIVGVLIAALVSADGESNWLEGAELLAVYLILALAFFLLPV